MQAALAIANDNVPALDAAASVQFRDKVREGESVTVTETDNRARSPRLHSPRPDIFAAIIGAWLLVGMATVFIVPSFSGSVAVSALGVSSVLTLSALGPRSTALLALAAIMLAAGTIGTFAAIQGPLGLLIVGSWAAGMWAVQAALAARWRSDSVALVSSASMIAVTIYLLGTVETVLGVLPVVASSGLVLLGLARLAVKSSIPTAEIHYAVLWCAVAGCALTVQQVFPDLPRPTQMVAVASSILAAAAALAWSMDKGLDVLTGLAIIAAFTLIYNGEVMDVMSSESLVSSQLLVPALFGAAVFAAGLALCVRGLKRGETLTMLLGAGAMLVEALIIGRNAPAEPELAALTVVLAGIFSIWLGALRS